MRLEPVAKVYTYVQLNGLRLVWDELCLYEAKNVTAKDLNVLSDV